MNFTFRPIDIWPGQQTQRRRGSHFKAAYSETLKLLDRELTHLKAREPVIQVDLAERFIRADGLPYANARPTSPRVIVSFGSRFGPLKYASDTYDDWQDNLRAIALGLEHLRAVDRYGITRRGEQYTGWKALPGAIVTPPPITLEEAAKVVARWGDSTAEAIAKDRTCFVSSYRRACKRTHPDCGGRAEDFHLVQQAASILEQHHGPSQSQIGN